MAANNSSVLYDIKDCTVYPLVSDVTGASAATYGTGIDVPGINALSLDPNIISAEIKGDSRVYATKARIDKLTGAITYSELALDVLAVILGGSIVDTGTGSSEIATYNFVSDELPYFKIEALIEDVTDDLAEVVIVIPKAKITGSSLVAQTSDNFAQPSFDFAGVGLSALKSGVANVLGWVEMREATSWVAGS